MPAQIFGRDAELRAIGTFLDVVALSPGSLVLAAPAGAGKTTLLRAGAAMAAERRWAVLQTLPAPSDVRLAFAGLADLLAPYLASVISELPVPQGRALSMALLLQETPADPPEPMVIAAAFRSVLGVLARSSPVLVVIDDVQWLDRPSGEAIGFAVRRLESEPVGLLCAQRTSRPGAETPLELDRARQPAEFLPVGALSLGALHGMLRTRVGTSFSHQMLRRVETDSGGNPFIALEIARALARRGITGAGTGALPVPDTLSGLVSERLGELPPAVLDTVRLVAVMPDAPFEQYLAAGAQGGALDAAVQTGVLELEGGRLRFSHPLLAAAVAGSIPPASLRELHGIAARVSRLPEERARHRALGATGPSAAVAAELDDAARSAASRGAPASAAELFELAASLTPEDQPAGCFRRRLAAAHELAVAGETRAAAASLQRLISSQPAGPDRARALSQLAWLREEDVVEAERLSEQALAEAGHDLALAADIHLGLSDILMVQGGLLTGRAAAVKGLAAAERTGDPALIAGALAHAFFCDIVCGAEVDERQLHRALELEEVSGASLLRPPSGIAGIWHFTQGRQDEAEAALRRMLARAEGRGAEYSRQDALLRLSLVAGRRGDASLAAELAAAGLEITEQLDHHRSMRALLLAGGRAALQLGQVDRVRDLAEKGVDVARRSGEQPYVALHRALLGSLDLALGDSGAAAGRFRPLIGLLLAWRYHPSTQGVVPEAVEALIGAGELEEAAALLAELERDSRDPVTAALIARCHGALAAARGNLHAAAAELTEAVRLQDLLSPQPLDRGRTLLVLGGVQRRLKQRGAARATTSEAIGIFDAISAPLWAARARAELARLSGRPAGSADFTVTERRVTELVARGMSNREVAAELFVTVRAVESTLTKAYAKLGVRSRTELAARLRDGG
ncbi:MAG: AAA family ATPase [Streptosporangiaceae bacterium]